MEASSVTDPWTICLPAPPSVNNLFATVGRKRVTSCQYTAWKSEADDALWLHRDKRHFKGRVEVEVRLGKRKGLADADNFNKPVLDWLVRHQIIVNDDSRYVRKITAIWDDGCQGALVTVREME
jgi:Holliday junction resolvase RusA-like endonuclease